MILRPNSIILPPALRKEAVVVVNEYPARGMLPVGHVDLTFFDHGVYQGTFGLNSVGFDAAGKFHPSGKMNLRMSMPGGVFVEPNAHAMSHFVIVSSKNYASMIAFAQSQAQLTTQNRLRYSIIAGNCADFAYQVFQHSDLPPRYRDISGYLKDLREPVAIYAVQDDAMYAPGSEKWSQKRKELQRDLVTVSVISVVEALPPL